MNYFIIGGDKKEYGPASAEQIRQWLRESRANGETLLRLENETLWKPLRSFEDFQDDVPAGGPPPVPNQVEQSAAAPAGEIVAANIPIGIGHAFGRAWHLIGEHFGAIAGATLLTWMALTALFFFPCVGPMLLVVLRGPLYAGLFMVFLKLIRTGEASATDVFAFSQFNAVSLMIASMVMGLLSSIGLMVCVLPGIYLKIAWLLAIPVIADRGLSFWDGMETSRKTVTPRWFTFFALFAIAFLPIFIFQIYMQAHIGMEMMPALSKALSGGDFKAFIVEMEEIFKSNAWLPVAGQILLLITMPLGFGSFAYVYDDLFGRKR